MASHIFPVDNQGIGCKTQIMNNKSNPMFIVQPKQTSDSAETIYQVVNVSVQGRTQQVLVPYQGSTANTNKSQPQPVQSDSSLVENLKIVNVIGASGETERVNQCASLQNVLAATKQSPRMTKCTPVVTKSEGDAGWVSVLKPNQEMPNSTEGLDTGFDIKPQNFRDFCNKTMQILKSNIDPNAGDVKPIEIKPLEENDVEGQILPTVKVESVSSPSIKNEPTDGYDTDRTFAYSDAENEQDDPEVDNWMDDKELQESDYVVLAEWEKIDDEDSESDVDIESNNWNVHMGKNAIYDDELGNVAEAEDDRWIDDLDNMFECVQKKSSDSSKENNVNRVQDSTLIAKSNDVNENTVNQEDAKDTAEKDIGSAVSHETKPQPDTKVDIKSETEQLGRRSGRIRMRMPPSCPCCIAQPKSKRKHCHSQQKSHPIHKRSSHEFKKISSVKYKWAYHLKTSRPHPNTTQKSPRTLVNNKRCSVPKSAQRKFGPYRAWRHVHPEIMQCHVLLQNFLPHKPTHARLKKPFNVKFSNFMLKLNISWPNSNYIYHIGKVWHRKTVVKEPAKPVTFDLSHLPLKFKKGKQQKQTASSPEHTRHLNPNPPGANPMQGTNKPPIIEISPSTPNAPPMRYLVLKANNTTYLLPVTSTVVPAGTSVGGPVGTPVATFGNPKSKVQVMKLATVPKQTTQTFSPVLVNQTQNIRSGVPVQMSIPTISANAGMNTGMNKVMTSPIGNQVLRATVGSGTMGQLGGASSFVGGGNKQQQTPSPGCSWNKPVLNNPRPNYKVTTTESGSSTKSTVVSVLKKSTSGQSTTVVFNVKKESTKDAEPTEPEITKVEAKQVDHKSRIEALKAKLKADEEALNRIRKEREENKSILDSLEDM